jgi:hypothetical protein
MNDTSTARDGQSQTRLEAEQRRAYEKAIRRLEISSSAFPFLQVQYGQERRVTAGETCPACNGESWCLMYGPPQALAAVLCTRESAGSIKTLQYADGEAYLFELPGCYPPAQRPAGYTTDQWRRRPTPVDQPTRSFDEWRGLHRQHVRALHAVPGASEYFANSLGVCAAAVAAYEVGWDQIVGAYSCPMRGDAGEIIGMHLRTIGGTKFAVLGSRNGLFYPRHLHPKDSLAALGIKTLVVAEGLSDALTLTGWGFAAIGRPSCSGGAQLVRLVVARLKPQTVVIVPDNDAGGQGKKGAIRLARELAARQTTSSVRIAELPCGVKDVRVWAAIGATATDFAALLAAVPEAQITVLPK